MALKMVLDSLEGVDENDTKHYLKIGEKFVCQVEGAKTQADVDKLTTALGDERKLRKAAEGSLAAWGDRKPEEVLAILDKVPELEAQASSGKNKFNQEQIDAIVAGKMNEPTRKITALEASLAEATKKLEENATRERRRTIFDAVRKEAVDSKAKPEAYSNDMGGLMLLSERLYEINDAGQVVVREGAPGLVAGLGIKDSIPELQRQHSYLWPDSNGGGASGNTGSGVPLGNPFKGNNMSARSEFVKSNADKPGVVERALKEAGLPHVGAKYQGK